MGCAACGARGRKSGVSYVSKGPRINVSRNKNMPKGNVVVANQPAEGNVATNPAEGQLDPSTGQKVSVIKLGSQGGSSLTNPVQDKVSYDERAEEGNE